MLHKLSLLMTGLVLMMGAAWFGLDRLMTHEAAAQSAEAASPATAE